MKQKLKKGKKKTTFMQSSRKNKKLDLKSSAFAESASDHIFSSTVIKENTCSEKSIEDPVQKIDMNNILFQAERAMKEPDFYTDKESAVSSEVFIREAEEKENQSDSTNTDNEQAPHSSDKKPHSYKSSFLAVSAVIVGAMIGFYLTRQYIRRRRIH